MNISLTLLHFAILVANQSVSADSSADAQEIISRILAGVHDHRERVQNLELDFKWEKNLSADSLEQAMAGNWHRPSKPSVAQVDWKQNGSISRVRIRHLEKSGEMSYWDGTTLSNTHLHLVHTLEPVKPNAEFELYSSEVRRYSPLDMFGLNSRLALDQLTTNLGGEISYLGKEIWQGRDCLVLSHRYVPSDTIPRVEVITKYFVDPKRGYLPIVVLHGKLKGGQFDERFEIVESKRLRDNVWIPSLVRRYHSRHNGIRGDQATLQKVIQHEHFPKDTFSFAIDAQKLIHDKARKRYYRCRATKISLEHFQTTGELLLNQDEVVIVRPKVTDGYIMNSDPITDPDDPSKNSKPWSPGVIFLALFMIVATFLWLYRFRKDSP